VIDLEQDRGNKKEEKVMALLQVLLSGLWLVGGSLLAAAVLSWAGWTAFKWAHHPELGVPILMLFCILASLTVARNSDFLKMTLFYSALAAIALWPAGKAWRKDHDY